MCSAADSLETAINSHSCALACLVSLFREFGPIEATQEKFIEENKSLFPLWETQLGALTPYGVISCARSLLKSKVQIFVEDPVWIRKHWDRPECFGGLIISQRQPLGDGKEAIINHCWRILGMTENTLTLMNPKMDGAAKKDESWDLLKEWKAYALIFER